ncbi:hypothetical protein LAZ67_10002821 [Cordylochernes scorpioides]|uniref:Autophagy-related protein 16 domain-containing protein n=1 Tax=Cordylochernes scorpioides TaxID=51811 RepID=A0ABY6KZ52_9ARAC|nr:hypothetical protein LAZ67_10002821 [Cordylochernes scorpioides]
MDIFPETLQAFRQHFSVVHQVCCDAACSLYAKNDYLEIQNAKLVSDLQMANATGGDGLHKFHEFMLLELFYDEQRPLPKVLFSASNASQNVFWSCRISELNNTLSLLQKDNQLLKEKLAAMDQTLETMKDEHAAQAMHLGALEIKNTKLEIENADLLERILAYKNKDVNDLNEECERHHRTVVNAASNSQPCEMLMTAAVCRLKQAKVEVTVRLRSGNLTTVGLLTLSVVTRLILVVVAAAATVTLGASLVGCNAQIMSIDFNPGAESMVLGGSNDCAIRLWTIADCRLRQTLTGHSNKVMAAKFFGDLVTQVVSGSHDRTLKIWDLRNRACMNTAFVGSACNDVVANNVTFISGHMDKKIRFWDARKVTANEEILFQGRVTSLDLSPDGNYLLCCVRDDTLKYLDLRGNKVVRTFSHENFKVGCDWTRAKFSPDGQYICAGSSDGSLIIWNTLNGRVEKVFKEHKTIQSCETIGNKVFNVDFVEGLWDHPIQCADAFRMLTVAYGEAILDRSNVYRWYKMFSEGREDVNDEERAGRPSTSTTDEKINEVEKMILANRRITVREVSEDLNISIGSCHSIFINDLGMRRVAAKFVPKLLNCDQKQHRMSIANEMLDSVRDDPNLLQRVITGDEAWVYGYDVETKAQSSQGKLPHEPRPKKARQVRPNVKVLLTVFFDCRGVVHHEFLPQGRTVNKEYYLQVMRNLREAIRQKRPDLWKNKNWFLHHDNAPAHTSLLVRDFLAKNNTLMMPQPPYSPDLAPCDFFLFPKLKRPMKGRRYATLDEIKTASKEELKKIFKNDFLKCFEDWKNRWHKCIISHGDYFEGDKIGIHE